MSIFLSLEDMIVEAFSAMRPSERLTVTQAAERFHIIRQPGAHSGPWSVKKTPYMAEPQDTLTSLDFTAECFVGPARTGKSASGMNWIVHTVTSDPADMMIVHMTQHTGRDWSKSDLEKMLRHSPEVKKLVTPGRNNDNTFDKEFISGMRLTITWPTANNLSGKTLPRAILMDYDRMPDNIDNEGNAFDLTRKRTTTYKRFGMTLCESSPNPDKEISDPKWTPKTPHQAPPIAGIFEIYNRGDRRWWYWKCLQCGDTFCASFKDFRYPDSDDFMESAEQVYLPCPHCGFPIKPSMKEELNEKGRWVKDGQIWLPDGKIVDRTGMKAARSDIASFWLKGPAAAYQDWSSLVLEYLRAEQTYEDTQDETPLRKTITADQGEYYIAKARQSVRKPDELKERAEDWGSSQQEPLVHPEIRFLIATIDVQSTSFVVQVQGFTEHGDMIIIDGFKIRKSARLDADGDPLPVAPFVFKEDWHQIKEAVIDKTYPLGDGSGRHMAIKVVGCDTGGEKGGTFNAYEYWRKLKKDGDGLHRRFVLLKGEGSKTAPRALVRWPESKSQDKMAAARGDIPVLFLNSNPLKDIVSGMLDRRIVDEGEIEQGGMIRFASWFEDWFYSQMTNEVRTTKGWENTSKRRNEVFDLAYYAIGIALRPHDRTVPYVDIQVDRIDWETNTPAWALPWNENELVFYPEKQGNPNQTGKRSSSGFAELGAKLA